MIYLNNAATSYPKPDIVKKIYMDALDALPSGQYRSALAADDEGAAPVVRLRRFTDSPIGFSIFAIVRGKREIYEPCRSEEPEYVGICALVLVPGICPLTVGRVDVTVIKVLFCTMSAQIPVKT